MVEQELSAEAKKYLAKLQQSGLAFNRKEAVEKLAKISVSNDAVVTALIRAREFDDHEAVRAAAAEALKAPAQQAVLDGDPDLETRASVAPKQRMNYSLLAILSYAIAMISILIVYFDLFVVDPNIAGMADPLGLGIGPAVVNSGILLAGSFLLPLAGLIIGILALRQYERKTVLGWIGLTGNAIILVVTSYAVISR
jgi:hypothetical protein